MYAKEFLPCKVTSIAKRDKKSDKYYSSHKGAEDLVQNRWPLDDFAPSYTSSNHSHAPETYPTEAHNFFDTPSSDDIYDPNQDNGPGTLSQDEEGDSTDSDIDSMSEFDSELSAAATSTPGFPSPSPSPLPSHLYSTPPLQPPEGQLSIRRTRSWAAGAYSHSPSPLPNTSRAVLSRGDMEAEITRLRNLVASQAEVVQNLTFERDAADTHAVLMLKNNEQLQRQLNGKNKDKTVRQIRMTSQILTPHALMAEYRSDLEKRAEKERKDEASKQQKEKAKDAQLVARALGTTVFSGSLSSKKKDELEDIAAALGLSEDGLKADIQDRIQRHLEMHPQLAENPRFAELFTSMARGRGPRGRKRRADSSTDDDEAVAVNVGVSADLLPTAGPTPSTPVPNSFFHDTHSYVEAGGSSSTSVHYSSELSKSSYCPYTVYPAPPLEHEETRLRLPRCVLVKCDKSIETSQPLVLAVDLASCRLLESPVFEKPEPGEPIRSKNLSSSKVTAWLRATAIAIAGGATSYSWMGFWKGCTEMKPAAALDNQDAGNDEGDGSD
ncbi:hypothetical protein FA95DRAFT_1577934 [Auriscalpium vulgare]|uniref:Uncharacterized protein n=1 Tax=Auriscalpium vulgare TaxID=40419 RepID=A0ACB8R4V3_9AGAM|nr:hypothetical protein FA95DRAFT_1577934 [Auriscalpium vulgare]